MDLNQYLNPDFMRYSKTTSTGTHRRGFNSRGRGQSRAGAPGSVQHRSGWRGRGMPPNAHPVPTGRTATRASGWAENQQPQGVGAGHAHLTKATGLSRTSAMGRTSHISSSSVRDFEIIARAPMKKPSATGRLWYEDDEDPKKADDHAGPSGSARDARREPRTPSRYIAVSSRSQRARGRPTFAGTRRGNSLLISPRSGTYVEGGKFHSTDDVSEEEDEIEFVNESSRSVSPNHRGVRPTRPTKRATLHSRSTKREGQADLKTVRKQPKAASEDGIIELTDSSEEVDDPSTDEDIVQMMAGISALGLSFRKPPFLRRNLRVGFQGRCEDAKIPTSPEPSPSPPMVVVYRQGETEDSDEPDAVLPDVECRATKWECPVCNLHRDFNNRAMLSYHLEQYHPNVPFSWSRNGNPAQWRIVLIIPRQPSVSDSSSYVSDDDDDDDDDDDESQHAFPHERDDGLVDETIPGPSSDLRTIAELSPPLKPIVAQAKLRVSSPTPVVSPLTNKELRASLPSRYPTPPPPHDRLGPAAQPPYLPYQGKAREMADDENYQSYSCRPGGPRLFDLLNTMDLECFGVLAWMIVDREEEIYEIEDIRDEDKVMLALWNRWIFLNRKTFVFKGYANGVTLFIDEFWRMIHLAAGWGALRVFLLMLLKSRFLTISEVAKLLKHYESKTGMDLWYK